MEIAVLAVLAVLAAVTFVNSWAIRKERHRTDSRFAELTRRIDDAREAAYKEARELEDSVKLCAEEIRKNAEALAEIPVDQLQSIYDSEKQFQDGLNSILNYYGPVKENETK